MKFTICTFNADFLEAKNILVEKNMLVNLGTQFSKLKFINK